MLLAIVIYLAVLSNLICYGHFIESKSSGLRNVVYVSKHRGESKEDCGNKSLPCKTLQVGLDKLAWGGQLYVDGENTQTNPYTCKSSAGNFTAMKSFAIQSYTMTARISCVGGFSVLAKDSNAGMNVTFTGVEFIETLLFLKDTSTGIRNCSFTASSPAIFVKISNDSPLCSLDIQNVVFTRNSGCIQVNVKEGIGCNRISMTLRHVVFQNNTTPVKSGAEATGLIFVRNKNCCCQEMSLFSKWENITVTNNSKKNGKDGKNYREEISANRAKSVFVVVACRVNLTFSKVKSGNNQNMRFLTSQSRDTFAHIENSSYHGHHIDQPGGVLHFKGNGDKGAFVNVTITDSVFFNNSGTLGGVLQIGGGKKQSVALNMSNVRISHSYGSVNGCAVSVGISNVHSVSDASVGKAFAKLDNLEVYECHNSSISFHKTKSSRNRHSTFCFTVRTTAKIDIDNSLFQRNKNQVLLIKHTGDLNDRMSTKGTLIVQIRNSSFIENSAPGTSAVEVRVYSPPKMKTSIFNISKLVFLCTNGTAILTRQLAEVYVSDLICNGTKKACLDIKAYLKTTKKQQSPINSTLHIENSRFNENGLPLKFTNIQPMFVNISIKNTIFYKHCFRKEALEIRVGRKGVNSLRLGSILMDQVFFLSNFVTPGHGSAGGVLGIIVPPNSGNFTVVVKNSVFKDNVHDFRRNSTTFLNLFFFYIPHLLPVKNRSILEYYLSGSKNLCPPFSYRNKITFDNVTFENNTAATSVLFITSGNVSFRSCLFKDNFSFQPQIGAHLYVEKGATSGYFYDTKFIQTKMYPRRHHYSLSPLLFFGAQGPLEMTNTSLKFDLFTFVTVPMFILQRGHVIQLDNDTTFVCPVGSYLKLFNSTFHVPKDFNEANCNLTIIRLRLRCHTCPVNTYTLESGSFRGTQTKKKNIECLKCPFGANCTKNIQSRPNFWGYKISENPPTLLFEKCPEGYCHQPKSSSNFSIFNKCAGNRNGTMCGGCKEGFTESMFNHKCRPISECQDYWFWVMAGLYSVVMAIFVLCQSSLILFLFKKTLWFKEKESSTPNSRVEHMKKTQGHEGHAYFKIIFYFYQVAELLMIESCSEILPQFSFLSTIISFYNFQVEVVDSSFGCPFPGLTAVTKELFRCLQVFATMVVIVVFYLIHWLLWSFRKRPTPPFAPYLAAIIEVLLLGYERLGHTSLKLLNCTPLDMLGKIEWRLVLDGNITCWVHWWQYVMIGYIIVFVVPFLLVLYIGTSKLKRQEISACHFVASCFVPLPFLVYWMLRRCCKTDDESEDTNQRDQEKRNALLGVLQGPFRPPDSQSRGALYWESVLIGRRLVMLCLFSFTARLLPRLLSMTFICMLILIHNVLVFPYKDQKANIFSFVLLSTHVVMATINLAESVLITAGIPLQGPLKTQIDDFKIFEVFLLSVLPCAFVLLIVAVVISQTVRLLLVVCRYCLRNACDNSQRINYQPYSLINPTSEEPNPLLG